MSYVGVGGTARTAASRVGAELNSDGPVVLAIWSRGTGVGPHGVPNRPRRLVKNGAAGRAE